MKVRPIVIVALSVGMLAGCAVSAPATKPFKTHFGQSAVTIANHIDGCKNVALFDVGDGTKSGVTSGATCKLDGREITLFSFKDAASSDMHNLVQANGREQYWAAGKGWVAFETDDSYIALQLTNDAKALSDYMFGKVATPSADVNGEKTAATSIAKSLDGQLEHYIP